jgi:hypothetical protein
MTFTPGNGNGNGGGDGTVVGLTDRYEELPAQTFSVFAHAGTNAASPTRDIQTALDSIPSGAAHQVLVGPGSYAGATVTIPSNLSNVAIIGPTAGDFGGTVVTLSSGRGLTIGNNATRVRVVSLQIEGLTTVSTSGAGVHRIERCQLEGGLTVGAISATIYVVGCTLGNVSINAGFTGLLLIERCQFNAGATFTNGTISTRVLMSDCAGLSSAPSSSAFLNGRFQLASGATLYYADGALLLKSPVSAVNSLTAAADRVAYYTSASAAAMTPLTAFGRSLIDDADASAARTTLGLGTAATANTGTSAGNVPVLDGSARLPAVDGSQLTNVLNANLVALGGVSSSTNKLPYFVATNTAAVTTLTQAGRDLIDDADAAAMRTTLGLGTAAVAASTDFLSGFAADSWTYEWANPSGALPSGWALTESPNAATVTYPTVGTGTSIRIVTGTSSTGYLSRTFSELTTETEWEARVEMLASTLGVNGQNYIVIRDGTKRIGVYPSSSGHVIETTTADEARAIASGAYYILTIQRTQGYVRFWCNDQLIDTHVYSTSVADTNNPGQIRIGTASAGSSIVTEIRSFKIKFGAINAAPPSHTLRGLLRGSP